MFSADRGKSLLLLLNAAFRHLENMIHLIPSDLMFQDGIQSKEAILQEAPLSPLDTLLRKAISVPILPTQRAT